MRDNITAKGNPDADGIGATNTHPDLTPEHCINNIIVRECQGLLENRLSEEKEKE